MPGQGRGGGELCRKLATFPLLELYKAVLCVRTKQSVRLPAFKGKQLSSSFLLIISREHFPILLFY